MLCPKCQTRMVKSHMWAGDEFDYCRTCKKELSEILKETAAENPPKLSTSSIGRAFYQICKVDTTYAPWHGFDFSIPIKIKATTNAIKFTVPYGTKDSKFPPAEWIPAKVPVGDNFHGVDRLTSQEDLAGAIVYGTGISTEEAVLNASMLTTMYAGNAASDLFMSPPDYLTFYKDMGRTHMPPPDIFFVQGAYNKITVHKDIDCPVNYAWLLDMTTWERVPGYGTICNAPGNNAVIRLGP